MDWPEVRSGPLAGPFESRSQWTRLIRLPTRRRRRTSGRRRRRRPIDLITRPVPTGRVEFGRGPNCFACPCRAGPSGHLSRRLIVCFRPAPAHVASGRPPAGRLARRSSCWLPVAARRRPPTPATGRANSRGPCSGSSGPNGCQWRKLCNALAGGPIDALEALGTGS